MSRKNTRSEDPEATELPAGGTEGNTGLVPNPPEAFLTEQEKGGLDPVSDPVYPGPLAEPMALAPREPYPTGDPYFVPVERVPMNQHKPDWYEPIPPAAA